MKSHIIKEMILNKMNKMINMNIQMQNNLKKYSKFIKNLVQYLKMNSLIIKKIYSMIIL